MTKDEAFAKLSQGHELDDECKRIIAESWGFEKVVQGNWIKYEVDIAEHPWHCSRCGGCPPNFVWHIEEMEYCNHCGAKMDERKDGEQDD